MANFQDTAKTTVIVDGKQGINELGKLEMEANEYRQALKGMRRDTSNYINTTRKLNDVKKRIKDMREEIGLAGMTMRQLRSRARELQRQLDITTTKGTAGYKKLKAELIQVNSLIARQRMDVRGMAGAWNKMGKSIGSALSMFGPVAMITTAIYALISAITSFVRETMQLSESFADVQKNTDLAREDVDKLYNSLMRMDTRSTRKELNDLVIIAGKLGIRGVANIEAFVAAADKINVALGEDLGDVNETMKSLGKLINVFKVDDIYGIEQALLKTGSAINDLGRKSVAQEKNIVEFTRRMGGIAPVTKVSIQDIMGLGAAGDSLGLSMEVMGTAMSQVFMKMSQGRAKYAKFAKDTEGNAISVKDFTRLINTDFNTALLAVLRGLNGNQAATTEFVDSLGDMGLEGQRVIQVVSALAMGVDDVVTQQAYANEAFRKGTSILEEFELKNETLGAKVQKIWKAISTSFVNSSFIHFLERGLDLFSGILPVAETATDRIRRVTGELNTELEALKNSNFTQEHRARIIQSINEKYKDYLPNLLSEKSTIEDITRVQAEANRHTLAKVALIRYEEELTAIQKDRFEAEENLWGIEQDRAKMREQMINGDLSNKELEATRSILKNQEDLSNILIDKIPARLEAAKKKFSDIAKSMGADIETLMAQLSGVGAGPAPSPGGSDEDLAAPDKKQLEAYQRYVDKLKKLRADLDVFLLDSELQEIARVERKYEDLMNEAREFYDQGITTEEQYTGTILGLNKSMDEELTSIFTDRNAKYKEEMKKLQEEIAFNLMGEEEQEIARLEAHYDKLLDAAEGHAVEMMKLEEAKAKGIEALKAYFREKEIDEQRENLAQIANNIGSSLNSIAALQNEHTEKGIENQRQLANASVIASNIMIAADQAAALGKAISAATTAGAATGPAAIVTIPLFITALVATVLGAFASIRSNNKSAKSAVSNLREEKAKKAESGKSYYHGNLNAPESYTGRRDMYGPLSGYASDGAMYHQGEGYIPAYVRQDPEVINAEAMIAAKAAGYSLSQSTTSGGSSPSRGDQGGFDAREFREGVLLFREVISVLQKHGVPAHFSRREFEDATDDQNEKDTARARSNI